MEQIPLIKNQMLNGIVEICRGCGRGCNFCNHTMLNYRCQSLENILEGARVNVDAGRRVLFHAEDVLRYKAKGFIPNEEEVFRLFNEVKKLTDNIGISHFAHASVASKPSLMEGFEKPSSERMSYEKYNRRMWSKCREDMGGTG